MGRLSARARRTDRGAAAVEFALVLPILAALVFGIINFGYVLTIRQAASQAADEGARAAAVAQSDPSTKGMDAIQSALGEQNLACTSGGCSVKTSPCTNDSTATCAVAVVSVNAAPLIPGFGFGLPNTLTYSASAKVN